MRLYEKNIIEPDRPQMKLWRMHNPCWIPKATDTHTQTLCNIYCFSTATIVAQTRLNLPYTYNASLVKISYQNRSSALQVFRHRIFPVQHESM
jgi:lysyl-tRNA synthetase class I